jgi:hypothetical protein
MSNPIASSLGITPQPVTAAQLPPQMSNMMNLISGFNQFRQAFSGDPRQAVQQLLNSGRMTQAQYNQLARQATELRNILGSMR